MKKLILALTMLSIGLASYADDQEMKAQGWCSGRYYYAASEFSPRHIVNLHLSNATFATGSHDTSFTPSNSNFTLTIPQPLQGTPTTFTISQSGWNSNDNKTGTNSGGPCTVTPVKWTGISVTTDANDSTLIHAKWTTTMEQNVKGFTLQASTNGLTWDDVKTIGSSVGGNSSTATVYSLDYNDPLVALVMTAGFGIFGSLLVIGLIVGFISKKHKGLGIAAAILLVFMMVSCSKHNDLATPKTKKYHYFRVVETDLDGTPTYSQVFMIK